VFGSAMLSIEFGVAELLLVGRYELTHVEESVARVTGIVDRASVQG